VRGMKLIFILGVAMFADSATWAAPLSHQAATSAVLRINAAITGGQIPFSTDLNSDYQKMLALMKLDPPNAYGAAMIAAQSRGFASYLGRRLAKQMQNPAYDASLVTKDNDATTHILAHFVGATQPGPVAPSISGIWSDNSTYLVRVVRAGVTSNVSAFNLTPAEMQSVNWLTDIVQVPGQQGRNQANTAATAIPAQHTGGYTTLTSTGMDNSFAQHGLRAGTNLRMIEGIWEVATGLSIVDFASADADAKYAPRFIPSNNINFFRGQGQPACITCHGGGISSITKGYSAVADIFDYNDTNGLIYINAPTIATRKSLGSDSGKRQAISTCSPTAVPKADCNDFNSPAALLPDQGWDVSLTWQDNGKLAALGWNAPVSGNGLNSLGQAIGKAGIIYKNLAYRVMREVCPLGSFTDAELSAVASDTQSGAGAYRDDIRHLVAKVVIHPSCL
jgi:hypothetical protein